MKEEKKEMELAQYILKNYKKKVEIRARDMKDFFKDKKAVAMSKNKLIYRVFRRKERGVDYSITILWPGNIGKELFMTRGHYHLRPYPELYILLEGKGVLLTQNKKSRKIMLKKNEVYYLPPGRAHRTINIGNKNLVLLTIQQSAAGHTYKKIAKEGFRQQVKKS